MPAVSIMEILEILVFRQRCEKECFAGGKDTLLNNVNS
jgi:hypothetical protein